MVKHLKTTFFFKSTSVVSRVFQLLDDTDTVRPIFLAIAFKCEKIALKLYNTQKNIVRDFHLDSEFCPLKNFTLTKDLGQVYTSHHRYED